MRQRLFHRLQLGDLALDILDPLPGNRTDADAIATLVVAQAEEFLHLIKGESEILGPLHEADDPHCLVWELAVPGRPPRRAGQQAAPLVVTQSLYVDARLLSRRSDSHR